MDRSAAFGRALRRTLCLLILGLGCITAAGSARAAIFVITVSGITTKDHYHDPYSDPVDTYNPLGPYSTTLSFQFPFPPPAYPGDWPMGFDSYDNDPTLGQLHQIFFPGYIYCCDGTTYTFGHRSFSYYFTTSEGTDFSIDITSLTDFLPTIDQPSPVDVDIGPATGSSGTFSGFYNYYKEPQYGEVEGFVTHLNIAVLGVVPEPSSWALMIVGFGAIGVALRRRGMFPAFARA